MKKVRVLKYLPNMSIGDEFVVDESIGSFVHCGQSMTWRIFYSLLDYDFFEWVEEPKSLRDKILLHINKRLVETLGEQVDTLSKIARDHYLEVFDKAVKYTVSLGGIRKALENS